MADSMIAAALAYAAEGRLVFPVHGIVDGRCTCGATGCKSPGKHPRTARGLKDASRDEATIRSWWTRHPEANVAIVTGRGSGIWAIDVDDEAGFSTVAAEIPPTLEYRTGGGGRHLIFATGDDDVKSATNVLGPGVDVRGEGGYIVVPPSVHLRGEYSLLEDRPIARLTGPIFDRVRRPVVAAPPRPPPPTGAAPMRDRAVAYIRGQVAKLAAATPGQRHTALLKTAKTCAGVLHYGVGADELRVWLLEACVANGSSGDKANERTIGAGISEGSQQPMTLEDRPLTKTWPEEPRDVVATRAVESPAVVVARLLGPLRASATKFDQAIGKGEKSAVQTEARAALAALVRDAAPLAEAVRGGGAAELEAVLVELAAVLKAREIDTLKRAIREVPEERRVTTIDLAVAAESRVFGMLQRTGSGDEPGPPKSNRHNMALILENDTRWTGRLRLNQFQQSVELDGKRIRNSDATRIARWFEQVYGLTVSTTMVLEVIDLVAETDGYHPVREYLDGLEWDGQPRLETLLGDYFGAEHTPLVGVMSQKWLIGAVARAFVPGCKVDTCVVLTGPQGARKSSALRALASPAWFADSTVNLSDKDRFQVLDGRWIYELAEVDSWSKHDLAEIKSYITSCEDNYRRSFGHYAEVVPRRGIFVGSTNEPQFLADPSGDRRWWPIFVGHIDLAGLVADRDQLWAEAVFLYRQGAEWWLTVEEEAARNMAARAFRVQDPWEPVVIAWVEPTEAFPDHHPPYSVVQIGVGALGMRPAEIEKTRQGRITAILRKHGWGRKQTRVSGDRAWLWWPPAGGGPGATEIKD